MIVAKYKFNPDTYADLLPEFNSGGNYAYTKSDVTNSDGTITRTINSDSLPTVMKFGDSSATTRASSLLEILDMNTSNLTTMDSMFRYCDNLTNISCSWDTNKVTIINNVFQGCSKLTSLDLSTWDTSKVKTMNYAFNSCTSLTSLDLSNWNTSNATSVNHMFRDCTSLTSVDLIGWDTSNLTNMSAMFYNCSSLISVNLNSFNTSKVTDMSYMFSNCSSLTSIVIDSWDTSQVTTMMSMFFLCSSLTSLDLSNWNTSRLTNTSYMFNGCNKLTSLDLSNWNTCRLTSMNYMFSECSSLTSLDLSNWNTSKVVSMNYVFSTCTSLTTLDLSNWHISESTGIIGFFVGSMPNLYKINLKYADEYTVSKVVIEFPNRISTTPGYVLSSVDFTSTKNWQRIKSSHNNFYLPQPLRKIGDVKDRLYWDENKGHYCIEQNIKSLTYKYEPSHNIAEYAINDYNYVIHIKLPIDNDYSVRDGVNWMYAIYSICDKAHSTPIGSPSIDKKQPIVSAYLTTIWTNRNGILFTIPKDKLTSLTVDGAREFLSNFGEFTIYYVLHDDYVNIIDLPYLNQKLTFDSYNPSTTIDIPNRPLKASKTYLDAPIARYRYTNLQPSTQYNVQFDCKGDSGIKVNLGGTEVTFSPTSDWTRKNLTITTPSELVNDKLSISNVGITSNNKVDNVMLFSEIIAQEPDYIDGIQNIGELQEDGTYKIDILSNDGNKIFDADTWVNSTLDGSMLNSGFYKVLGSNMIEIIANDTRTANQVKQIQLKPNTKYSILCNDASLIIYIFFKLQGTGQISGKSKIDFTTDETGRIGFKIPNGVGKIVKIDIVDEKGFNYSACSTQSILLPQPLNKIGDVKDRLYWDYGKGHYCIEQNITRRTLLPPPSHFYNVELSDDSSYIKARLHPGTYAPNHNLEGNLVRVPPLSNTLIGSDYYHYEGVNGNVIALYTNVILKFETKYLVSNDAEGLAQWFIDNPTYIEYVCYPQIIDLTEMNQKITFDTYLPNISMDVTNLPLQPYSLLLEDDTVRYKTTIEPSTLYTIQFNCLAKSTTNLTLDLGGSRKTVDPIIGVNHVQITTPSELTSDRLFLIGTGIIINEVIVNKGDMNQYTKYFDGEQGVGELQEDGSYIIRISTDNYTGLWEGDL